MSITSACRLCGAPLCRTFCDLGMSPLSNSYLRAESLAEPERFFPLRVFVCDQCLLVQLPATVAPADVFSDYAYFSSYSDSWLAHAREYAFSIARELDLGPSAVVMEIASNDGYLLRNFVEMGIPVLGIEPAANVAAAAEQHGVRTLVRFFGSALARELASQGLKADLIVANNVLAHVPDLADFVAGVAHALKPGGLVTMEFPHLLRLMAGNQFDTIYHEHFSYFSLLTAQAAFATADLVIVDVEEIPTHGGSLRVRGCHRTSRVKEIQPGVAKVMADERAFGLHTIDGYGDFSAGVAEAKRELLSFLVTAKREDKAIAGYGAAAKGNTLLNYCGIRTDFLDYVVDKNPAKAGRYLPGTRIPVFPPERIFETRPEYVLILPWNLAAEITSQMAGIREWGGRFVVPIPRVRVFE